MGKTLDLLFIGSALFLCVLLVLSFSGVATQPAALQLRLLQTMVEVAAEKNATVVLPFPVELLRFLEHATAPAPAGPEPAPTANGLPVPRPTTPPVAAG